MLLLLLLDGAIAIVAVAVVEVAADARNQGTVGGIMKIFGLFAHTILAGVLKTTLDTTLARSLVTCRDQHVGREGVDVEEREGEKAYRKSDGLADKRSKLFSPSSCVASGHP